MQPLLEEWAEITSVSNNRTKMMFLQQQKGRLEVENAELLENARLMRQINSEICRRKQLNQNQLFKMMNQQNQYLQKGYQRLLRENKDLTTNILLQQQILNQNENEYKIILKNYEEKIIELRRSIQFKQGYIQELESRVKEKTERILTPLTTVTSMFFSEVDDLKGIVAQLTNKQKQIVAENQTLRSQNDRLLKKVQLYNILTQSKLAYGQIRREFEGKKLKTVASCKNFCLPARYDQLDSNKKLKEGQTKSTREYSEHSISIKDSSVKQLIIKLSLQNDSLSKRVKQQSLKVEELLKDKLTLARANSQYLAKQKSLINDLNYYKSVNQQMINMFACKKDTLSRSLQKSKKERLVLKVKNDIEDKQLAVVIESAHNKKYWHSIQENIKIDKRKIIGLKKKYLNTYRSISCWIDYRKKDQSQYFIEKKEPMTQNKRKEPLNNQFSLFMQIKDFENDFSIIHSGQKKKNYKNWKNKVEKKQIIQNMTILEENLL